MKRCFVTFCEGNLYRELCESLEYSIRAFSEYPLVKYSAIDFDIEWSPESWIHGYVYIYKILSCRKALEEYDEVVWLDNDLVVSPNIDRIWDFEIGEYPLLPLHRFYNFENWPHIKFDVISKDFESRAKEKVGLDHQDFPNVYKQACIMLFDRKCVGFLKEVLSYFDDYSDGSFSSSGDEMIINSLMWRDKLNNNLGNINLCTYHFSPTHINRFIECKSEAEYSNLFDPEKKECDLDHDTGYSSWNKLKLIETNNMIFILHGSKSPEYNSSLVDNMIKWAGTKNVIMRNLKRFPF